MGSFNAVCIVSGLPIEGGDKVRFLVLARSAIHKDGNDHVNYVNGRWKLFGIPVRATYNDYGSVEEIEEGPGADFLFSCLKAHSVEVGQGDNQAHDIEVVPEMGRKSWLRALWEGRVWIRECRPMAEGGESTWEPTKGVPTFRRVKECLAKAGHPIQSRDGAEAYVQGFMVDDASPGFVRVRPGGYGSELDVASLLPCLHEAGYAAMVVAGSGSYASRSELLVAPLPPGDPNVHIIVRPYGAEDDPPHTIQPRPASQAMIREDVWQLLLSLPGWTDKSVEDMKKDALAALEEAVAERVEEIEDPRELLAKLSGKIKRMLDRETTRETNFFRDVIRDRIESLGFGLQSAFEAAADPEFGPEAAKRFVQDIAETAFAQFAYDSVNGQWQPRSNGGQDPNWEGHHGYLLKLVEIAAARGQDQEDEYGEEDEEDESEED